ncbi:MAG: hypothetical protein E7A27_17920 [Erysipelotrichaceae bacterium]|nr:hypothetical protein [Erysipelotrichaceae bacterium]
MCRLGGDAVGGRITEMAKGKAGKFVEQTKYDRIHAKCLLQ